MKYLIPIAAALGVIVGGFLLLNSFIYQQKQGNGPAVTPKDAAYVIDGKVVQLQNGSAETEAAPGSASKIVTRYFGNEVTHDFDKDGRDDTVFLLTQETGGSGTFFYVVAALNKENGYEGSQALFLGDRIAPQSTHMGTGDIVVVNYADRKVGEDFSVRPSVGKSIWLKLNLDSMQFGEVAQNFEGEADPSRMTLGMQTWTWVSALYNDGREIKPIKATAFTISFGDGEFTATTDCNQMGGTYTTSAGGKIAFADIFSTKMFCQGSQEMEFSQLLTNSSGYHFTSKGELILDLKFDSGSVVFR